MRITTAAGALLIAAAGAACLAGSVAAVPVTIHRTCPTAARHTAQSHEPDADQRLVPDTPRAMLLCRYHNLNPPRAEQLDASRLVVAGSAVRALAGGLNTSTPFPEVTSCPRDDGSRAVAYFRYGDGREVPITIGLSGCLAVSNGHLTLRGQWKTIQLVKRLTKT